MGQVGRVVVSARHSVVLGQQAVDDCFVLNAQKCVIWVHYEPGGVAHVH